jgi:chromosomal replication initiation ATPase DnaA
VIRQLAFDLPAAEAFGRSDFFVSPANAAALGMIDLWQLWPGGMLMLVGPEGAGKTHLARIWAAEAEGAHLLPAVHLAACDLPALIANGALAVEDADRIAGDPSAETALFHLFNMARAAGTRLLITARQPPRDWGLQLPDLSSRLQSLTLTRLAAPDDALLSAVLAKLFADRQVTVPPTLIAYLVPRMERSIDAARRLVADLDARALSRGGPVTRADAAALFDAPLDRPDAE